jgi:predicted neuraminidase
MMLGLYSDVFNCSLAAFTNDWGKTWEFSRPILDLGNIQPSFVRKRDGTIVAFMRDSGLPKRIRLADSTDGGITWSKVRTMDIPNPGSSLECIPLKSGSWVLVCNDTMAGRYRLTAYLSDDEGATWKWKRSLELFEKDRGSASYPSVIQAADGSIHCTYSFTRAEVRGSTIKHARFNEEWVRAGNG